MTWKISQDQFANLISTTPRLLAGDNPPDLIRLPTMVSLVKDDLLKNLDDYVTAFGWDKWPASQLAQIRVGTDGTRGAGSLYAAGLNYSLTGVFYNKKLAPQIGMTEPPKTVAEFEDLLAKAKAAGLQPIMQWNAAASGAGLAFPLQQLMAAYGPTAPINDWIFQKSGATIDTPTNVKAAAASASSGSRRATSPKDANAIEYTETMSRFGKGEGVFMFDGDWQNAGQPRQGPVRQHRLLRVAAGTDGGCRRGDVGAADLRHRCKGQARGLRRVLPQLGGDQRRGPTGRRDRRRLAIPAVRPTRRSRRRRRAPSRRARSPPAATSPRTNGAMDFIANATGAIYAKGWTPELQKLIGGKQTPEGLLKAVQAEYEKELAQ